MEDKKVQGLGSVASLKLLLDKLNETKIPEGSIQDIANKIAGKRLSEADLDVKVKPNVSAKIAEAYSQMQHNPNDPKVQKAYQALIDETTKQYEALEKTGLKISRIGEGMPNPYKNSADLANDVVKNKHIAYFPTETGFGAGTAADAFQDHPLMKPSKVIGPDGKPMLANDLFRVVHDYFGHAKDGNKFGATGEERAYLEHKKMFSPEAQKALASETRGQNSWVNYGPQGEANRANPANTTYADQKAGLLPDWATRHVDEIDNPLKYRAKAAAKLAGKAVLPIAAATSVFSQPTLDTGIADVLVPGGVDGAGMSPEDEKIMLAEIQARKNYNAAKVQNMTPNEGFDLPIAEDTDRKREALRKIAGN